MNDRELLELAARAAGYYDYECTSHSWNPDHDQHQVRNEHGTLVNWNPLTDDGDALRLAVKLKMTVDVNHFFNKVEVRVYSGTSMFMVVEESEEIYAATRRAIVRAAAEIGKEQP